MKLSLRPGHTERLPLHQHHSWAVTDPGFREGGSANSKGGCGKLLFGHFFTKLYEI